MLKFPKSTLLQSSSFLFRAIFNCTTLLQSRLLMFWSNASKFIFYLISCSLWALETLNDVEEKVRYLLKHSTLKKFIIDVATKKSVNLSEIIFPFKTIFSSPKEPEINESFIYFFFFWGGGIAKSNFLHMSDDLAYMNKTASKKWKHTASNLDLNLWPYNRDFRDFLLFKEAKIGGS